MPVTEALLGEHAVLYAQFDYMEQVAPSATLEQIRAQAGLLAAALVTHAHLEDEVLFTALDPGLNGGGPLAVMRHDHVEIESALDRLTQVEDLTAVGALLRHVVWLAREHFAREERILFPMARQTLSRSTLEQLGRDWAERRGVTLA